MATETTRRRSPARDASALSPERMWKTITLATLLLVPAYWSLLAGVVSAATRRSHTGPEPGAALAFGLVLIPFSFIVLAFMSGRRRAPGAVAWALVAAVVIGLPVAALAADAVTGIVAGVGAGGVVALRADEPGAWKARAAAVALAATYTFILARAAPALALLPAPIFPFTAVGLADQVQQWRLARAGQAWEATGED